MNTQPAVRRDQYFTKDHEWVRLEGKGWRKLEYQLTEEQLKELADLGLSVNEAAEVFRRSLHFPG